MPPVTRFVAWKYKDSVTIEQKRSVAEGMLKLYADVSHLTNHGPIAGKDVSNLGMNKGLDCGFVVEFKREEARDEFNSHPLHVAFQREVMDFFEDVFVNDIIKGEFV